MKKEKRMTEQSLFKINTEIISFFICSVMQVFHYPEKTPLNSHPFTNLFINSWTSLQTSVRDSQDDFAVMF